MRLIRRWVRGALRRLVPRPVPAPPPPVPLQLQFAPPGHFYSPLPDIADVERNAGPYWSEAETEPDNGIDFDDDGHRRFIADLADWAREFECPDEPTPGRRYYGWNHYFAKTDALILYGVMRRHRPQRVIEVGSGFSSAAMLDIDERHLGGQTEFTFIEPDTVRLDPILTPADRARCRVVRQIVQDVPLDTFAALQEDDVLFIDSSHVAKIGSDVNHLLFRVLPRLRPGVLVHVHDMFFPFEYPIDFYRDGRAWNEVHLMRAFLMYNTAFRPLFFGAYAAKRFADQLRRTVPQFDRSLTGSLWLRRV